MSNLPGEALAKRGVIPKAKYRDRRVATMTGLMPLLARYSKFTGPAMIEVVNPLKIVVLEEMKETSTTHLILDCTTEIIDKRQNPRSLRRKKITQFGIW